jgi:hypothetical protein
MRLLIMFLPSRWIDERKVAFPHLRPSPMQHVLASWVVTVALGFVALAASHL